MFVIKAIDKEGVPSFYDGSVFVLDSASAKVISTLQDARYLQGVFQSQMIEFEVSKVSATVSVSFG